MGAIKYTVETFYMSTLDGDKTYVEMKAKIDAGESLTKQDLMSVVFLPMMKSDDDKMTRFEQAILLSKSISDPAEQAQILEMLKRLAEKFIKDTDALCKLKEMINMGIINEMIANDKAVEIAKSLLRDGFGINLVMKHTGLSEADVRVLKDEVELVFVNNNLTTEATP